MARSKATLITEMNKFLQKPSNFPIDRSEAADAWADAYKVYALESESCSVPGTMTPTSATIARDAMRTKLFDTAFVAGNFVGAANGVRAALDAFWPVTVFSGVTPGAGAISTTSAAFAINFANTLNNNLTKNADDSISDIVDRLHEYTDGVVVTHPGGGGCTGVIS